jgi:hypothetical protein
MISSSSVNILLHLILASYDAVFSGLCVLPFQRNNTEEGGSMLGRNGGTSSRLPCAVTQRVYAVGGSGRILRGRIGGLAFKHVCFLHERVHKTVTLNQRKCGNACDVRSAAMLI